MDNSNLFNLNSGDFVRGAVSAVVAAVVIALGSLVSEPDFSLFTTDWTHVFQLATNAAFAAFVGYIGKNFLTASNGKVFGKIG